MIRTIRVSSVEKAASRLTEAAHSGNRKAVEAIMSDVRRNGDAAVLRHERRFGSARSSTRVTEGEIREAFSEVSESQIGAIRLAKSRLEKTESAVRSNLRDTSVSLDGVRIKKRFAPIPSVGCYVPGGLARYPSSAVMSVTPAKAAGVRRIVAVSPPKADGKIDPLTAVAASICGATEIYAAGGAQAIAALCFGTESIPRVDKIVGPGGPFVTLAKSAASRQAAIDMLAGPTELGIIADDSADPRHVALDLISQSEHSRDTRCFLITDSPGLAKSVKAELSRLVRGAGRRDIVAQSLRQNGFAAVCRSAGDMAELADRLAPEHLQIIARNAKEIASGVSSAGLVLIGSQSPSAASDYLLGSNHILPTGGSGRTRGSLSVLDFLKLGTEVRATRAALARISGHMKVLTDAEGLPGHYGAVRGRLE